MATVTDILKKLQQLAPLTLAEEYDNCGLLVGEGQTEVRGVLCALELTSEALEKALEWDCNLVLCHHPLIFRPLKRLSPRSGAGGLLYALVRHNVAVIAMHTNWDRIAGGTSFYMCRRMGLKNLRVLAPEPRLSRLSVVVPWEKSEKVKQAIGNITFSESLYQGERILKELVDSELFSQKGANPAELETQKVENEKRVRLSFLLRKDDGPAIIEAIPKIIPGEECWLEWNSLDNMDPTVGYGCVGEFPEPLNWPQLALRLKEIFGCQIIRHSPPPGRPLRIVAFCGGSGAFLYTQACAAGADIFITGDVKYHDLAEALPGTMLVDIGHYESEHLLAEQFAEVLREQWGEAFPVYFFKGKNPILYT
ncbi:MAG: Nif3-like dinuclear metal center hexameric protein [Flavobacteriales bacterium]|nr:Nif3-like dinuclear metal center hexameric protein [Flavobacteriales bacterium]MCX7768419.1 Nif3-like dinuclear metal center hexameric protein [Flavobacteriales bacterium]MDW8409688.1 Nif3-like dinuclear metal center hexameric protein [Flavobacteriales bacterium]